MGCDGPGEMVVVSDGVNREVGHAVRGGLSGALQIQPLAVVLERARIRPEDLHVLGHCIASAECSGAGGDEQRPAFRRKAAVGGERITQPRQFPGVGGVSRIK